MNEDRIRAHYKALKKRRGSKSVASVIMDLARHWQVPCEVIREVVGRAKGKPFVPKERTLTPFGELHEYRTKFPLQTGHAPFCDQCERTRIFPLPQDPRHFLTNERAQPQIV